MNKFNIKRSFGTMAVALTLSVASLCAQAATSSTVGTLDNVSALGGAFGVVVGAEAQWGIDTTAAAGNLGVADIDAARFVVYSGLAGSPVVVPMVLNSNIQAASLTWDGTDITGGTITFDAAAATTQRATISVDFDAGTFAIWSGIDTTGGTGSPAYAAGGTFAPPTTPGPGLGPTPGAGTATGIPTMSAYGLVLTTLGMIFVALRRFSARKQ